MTTVKGFAPAKINLTLHVTGQRADGYHLLDSLVMFADVGDRISVTAAAKTTLDIDGPMATDLTAGGDNLVLRAADLIGVPAQIILEKNLPIAAGMGGGSSDAAACLRALSQLADVPVPQRLDRALGADVPVCMIARAARMAGIGERVTPLADLPELFAVLVNPRVGVSTPDVFKAMKSRNNTPMPRAIPSGVSVAGFIAWLAEQRNDLEAPAIAVQPVIADVLAVLAQLPDVRLHRMSGSGASCFALFDSFDQAGKSAQILRQSHPQWWGQAARLN